MNRTITFLALAGLLALAALLLGRPAGTGPTPRATTRPTPAPRRAPPRAPDR